MRFWKLVARDKLRLLSSTPCFRAWKTPKIVQFGASKSSFKKYLFVYQKAFYIRGENKTGLIFSPTTFKLRWKIHHQNCGEINNDPRLVHWQVVNQVTKKTFSQSFAY